MNKKEIFQAFAAMLLFSIIVCLHKSKYAEGGDIPGDPYYAENKYYVEREAAIAQRDVKKRKKYQPPYATTP